MPAWIGAWLLAGTSSCGGAQGPSALLITLDTTNPEALSCYGGEDASTPHLDGLAADGILFENARTVAPITLPAHASMLTGLYPVRHSVRRNSSTVLPGNVSTLAELARAKGHATAAFVSAVVLDPVFGLGQGFERYECPETPSTVDLHLAASLDADDIVGQALAWLDEIGGEHFFLWLHFYDPHFPYAPPDEYLSRVDGDAYLAEVSFVDAQLGLLFERLRETGRYDRTLIVVVGDHGEGRGRHGEKTHGCFVFDSTLRVPLIVKNLDGLRSGERLDAITSVVDVFPTIRNTLGLESKLEIDGVDLLAGPLAEDRGVYFESYFGVTPFTWSQLAGWVDANGKYIHSSEPQFFAIGTDPEESTNLLDAAAATVDDYEQAVAAVSSLPRYEPEELEEDERSLLIEIEKLGYAGADVDDDALPEPLDDSDRPSPHARIEAYANYTHARELIGEESFREAADLLMRVVATNPHNHKAQFFLGECHMRLTEWGAAIQAFRRSLEYSGGERIPAQLNLAVCLYNVGDLEGAIETLEEALSETVGPPGAMELLIDLLRRGGREDEARAYEARLREESP